MKKYKNYKILQVIEIEYEQKNELCFKNFGKYSTTI